MRIKYNAPTVLTFTFISVLVMFLSQTLMPSLNTVWFAAPGKGDFSLGSFRNWATLLTHIIGHADWNHLISNFSLILLLGPILEENYGSRSLLCMILITALITGVLNLLLFSTGLLGASGVVFMMILLASFTNFNINKGEIPLTFILILVLYVGGEFLNAFNKDNISHFAHIAGGICGSLFGFFRGTSKGVIK